jgi:hypothetical protein
MKSLAYCPNRRDSAKPAGAFHDWANLNLAKRRLCDALGTSLGSAAHCCAISVARVRAALTASIPRSNRPLARRATFGAAKSCIFMNRPRRPEPQPATRITPTDSRPYHGSRRAARVGCSFTPGLFSLKVVLVILTWQGTVMPITAYLDGLRFDPETTRLMGVAFEMALVALRHTDGVDPPPDAVARKIIELANPGGRDPEQLCEGVLKELNPVTAPNPPPPRASPRVPQGS